VAVVWSLLVALKWAQPLYDFILWAHMIHLQLTIGPFELAAAATVVVATFFVGCVLGYVFAMVWNLFHRATTA
jgi:MFS superfamily sulfate permease-like transporter